MSLEIVSQKISKLRASNDYKIWRDTVLKRDNYKCVLCLNDKNLEVDHIKPLALFPQLALNIENGRTLCHKCHLKTDTYGSASKFKGESPIHPILSGDLLYKLKSLPSSIEINGKQLPFGINYQTYNKIWIAGYKFAKIKLIVKGNDIEEAIDKLFDILRYSATSKIKIFERKEIQSLENISWNKELENITHTEKEKHITKDFGDNKKTSWIAYKISTEKCLLCNRNFEEDAKYTKIINLCQNHYDKIEKKCQHKV